MDEKNQTIRIGDIFAEMIGGKLIYAVYINIPINIHMIMDEENSKMQALSTHKELFKMNNVWSKGSSNLMQKFLIIF